MHALPSNSRAVRDLLRSTHSLRSVPGQNYLMAEILPTRNGAGGRTQAARGSRMCAAPGSWKATGSRHAASRYAPDRIMSQPHRPQMQWRASGRPGVSAQAGQVPAAAPRRPYLPLPRLKPDGL